MFPLFLLPQIAESAPIDDIEMCFLLNKKIGNQKFGTTLPASHVFFERFRRKVSSYILQSLLLVTVDPQIPTVSTKISRCFLQTLGSYPNNALLFGEIPQIYQQHLRMKFDPPQMGPMGHDPEKNIQITKLIGFFSHVQKNTVWGKKKRKKKLSR